MSGGLVGHGLPVPRPDTIGSSLNLTIWEIEEPNLTDQYAPKIDKTRSGRSEAPHRSIAGYDFSHPSLSGQVQVRHKLDLDWLVDIPTLHIEILSGVTRIYNAPYMSEPHKHGTYHYVRGCCINLLQKRLGSLI